MGKAKTIRVLPVVWASWRSAFAAFQRMKALFAIVSAMLIAVGFLWYNILNKLLVSEFGSWLFLLPAVVGSLFAVVGALPSLFTGLFCLGRLQIAIAYLGRLIAIDAS